MINFAFHLTWPWFKDIYAVSKDYFWKCWQLSKNKALEIQVSRGGDSIVGLEFRWDVNCDHAGVSFDIELFRRFLHVNLYDKRHWNYEKNRYVNYDDPDEVAEYW